MNQTSTVRPGSRLEDAVAGTAANTASAPVAETAAPPASPATNRGDDRLPASESILLLTALGTLVAVITGIFLI